MIIDPQVIHGLNQVLADQLVAINQYFLHARIAHNWGMKVLGKLLYRASIAAMKDADDVIERILMLEGLPNLQDLGKLYIGENVEEVLNCDWRQEEKRIKTLRQVIALCEQHKDYVSRDLLESFLDKSENYRDELGDQLQYIKEMGIENYIQNQI